MVFVRTVPTVRYAWYTRAAPCRVKSLVCDINRCGPFIFDCQHSLDHLLLQGKMWRYAISQPSTDLIIICCRSHQLRDLVPGCTNCGTEQDYPLIDQAVLMLL